MNHLCELIKVPMARIEFFLSDVSTSCCFLSIGKQVVYWEDDTKPDTVGKVRISANYSAVNVTGLKANTQYYLALCTFNTAGTGPQSTPINATTKKPRE